MRHGSRVETRPKWFCEGVWDGEFDAGDFDLTDVFFGSGARIRSGILTFVPSAATVDRLQYFRRGERLFVSNSLACLYAMEPSWLDPCYMGYKDFFRSITKGIDHYEKDVHEGGPTLLYFKNLAWDGCEPIVFDKPNPRRDFGSFEQYVDFLSSSLAKIGSNIKSVDRGFTLKMIGSASSGYDSPAIAAVARSAGLREVLCVANARGGDSDSGEEIANQLGLDAIVINRFAWREKEHSEIPFIAGDAAGGDVFVSGAEAYLTNSVFITGYHGDKVWEKNTSSLSRNIERGDPSGLSLTECRLNMGLIHVPVAFMGVRDMTAINAISKSPELSPWDIGGRYNRPICRRILEEAGVPRTLFGQKKNAAGVRMDRGDISMTHTSRIDFLRWHRSRLENETTPEKICPVKPSLLARWYLPEIWFAFAQSARAGINWLPKRMETRLQRIINHINWRYFKRVNRISLWTFAWALDRYAQRFYSGRKNFD